DGDGVLAGGEARADAPVEPQREERALTDRRLQRTAALDEARDELRHVRQRRDRAVLLCQLGEIEELDAVDEWTPRRQPDVPDCGGEHRPDLVGVAVRVHERLVDRRAKTRHEPRIRSYPVLPRAVAAVRDRQGQHRAGSEQYAST